MKRILNLCVLGLLALSTQAQNNNIVQRSRVPYPGTSNIWGHVDTTGKEYALVGANNQLSIVDVTNPDVPVKRFSVPGPNSAWREIRTWGKYAYVTTEGGGGLTIVDMRFLPDTIYHKQYTGNGAINGQLDAIHALHIDNGKLYLYGGDLQGGRAKIFSLSDPWNPNYLGTVSDDYVHDGFVKNDTLYSCQIYDGVLEIIDATNPASPVIIASQVTPKQFTHNSWMSTNGKVMYTTDEVEGSWVVAYDISDLQNIKELDRYIHNNSGSIGHNTYVLNNSAITGHNTDFLWTSYYTDGITVVDAARPDNLVEIGNFDSSPNFSGDGFHGAWGVYPYLPSGNILISDIERGMLVVTPTYKRACYLEGTITDAITNIPIAGASITVLGKTSLNGTSNLSGMYKNGTVDTGTYVVEISSHGYVTKTVTVVLEPGVVTPLNIALGKQANFTFNTILKDSAGAAIAGANVLIRNSEYTYETTTNGNGVIDFPVFYAGKYALYVGKFGYQTVFIDSTDYLTLNDVPNLVLAKGYEDDFFFDFDWQVVSTATTGNWVKAKPIRTTLNGVIVNPDADANGDLGDECYVTGNGQGNVTFDDIDGGVEVLTSPAMDLTSYTNPYINYQRWFTNVSGSGTPNDTFRVSISNGSQMAMLEESIGNNADKGKWIARSYRVTNFLPVTNNMKLIIRASDLSGSDHITEAAFDKFFVSDSTLTGIKNKQNSVYASVFPNPTNGKIQISYSFKNANSGTVKVYDILGNTVFEKSLTDSYGIIHLQLENKGMYFVRVESDQEQKVIKVVKQ
jgi:choice-of-anchor B domain-containing protein